MNKHTATLLRASYGNIDVLVPTWANVSTAIYRSQLRAKFEPNKFARKTTKQIENEIDAIWKNKCSKNNRLYNKSKFRLAGCEIVQNNMVIYLGLTTYKDMCGTNLSENFPYLQVKGVKDFHGKQAYLSDALGVGLVAVTQDGCLVVTRRAQWTGECPGALDRPGGHPEPSHIFLADGSLRPKYSHLEIDEAVLQEVWESASQEAVDELGINDTNIEGVLLMGVCLNSEAAGRPSLEYFAKLEVSSDQVASTYKLGKQAEAEESTSIHLLPPKTLAMLSRLLSPLPFTGGTTTYSDDHDGLVEQDVHLQKARWVLEEATPGLRAALLLAFHHHLLPLSS